MSQREVKVEEVIEAKRLASENYGTWGDTVVECYELEELVESLADCDSLEDWVQLMKDVASVGDDIRATAF
jgi:hypothetical protein|tara:strand:+ start:3673 stop:3885 length:213 start_codon:yes stop_codon:yes gene_type:complete